MGDLKPCPFCGETPDALNEATFQSDQGTKWGFVVCCCNGPEVRTGYCPVEEWKQDAIDAWNTRADATRIATLEAERDKLIEFGQLATNLASELADGLPDSPQKTEIIAQIASARAALGDSEGES